MKTKGMYGLALALIGSAVAASGYFMRRNSQRRDAKLQKEELQTWEGEGGMPAAPSTLPAQADSSAK